MRTNPSQLYTQILSQHFHWNLCCARNTKEKERKRERGKEREEERRRERERNFERVRERVKKLKVLGIYTKRHALCNDFSIY